MTRILVTGASGMLGLNFCLKVCEQYEVVGVCHTNTLRNLPFEMIQRDFFHDSVEKLIEETEPDVILHCAAMANVDACEKDADAAKQINGVFPGKLAAEARKNGVKMVHISTDAVFDGVDAGENGYREMDETNPINTYAKTKLLGEQNVLDANPDALVARVNFYGWSITGRRSLGEIFYHNLSEGKEMNGFTDIFFTTLYVGKLTEILTKMIRLDAKGIYHVFSSEYQSKYAFGLSIARKFGLDGSLLHPISWKDAGLTAVRSPNLIMNTDKLSALLKSELPDQRESLECFSEDHYQGLSSRIMGF